MCWNQYIGGAFGLRTAPKPSTVTSTGVPSGPACCRTCAGGTRLLHCVHAQTIACWGGCGEFPANLTYVFQLHETVHDEVT